MLMVECGLLPSWIVLSICKDKEGRPSAKMMLPFMIRGNMHFSFLQPRLVPWWRWELIICKEMWRDIATPSLRSTSAARAHLYWEWNVVSLLVVMCPPAGGHLGPWLMRWLSYLSSPHHSLLLISTSASPVPPSTSSLWPWTLLVPEDGSPFFLSTWWNYISQLPL